MLAGLLLVGLMPAYLLILLAAHKVLFLGKAAVTLAFGRSRLCIALRCSSSRLRIALRCSSSCRLGGWLVAWVVGACGPTESNQGSAVTSSQRLD